ILDYNCGTRSYDTSTGYNHQGTDIVLWPFAWNRVDDDAVLVVAGAPGVIVNKSDGNFDRNCAMNNGNWNAVYIRHADGSVAWYGINGYVIGAAEPTGKWQFEVVFNGRTYDHDFWLTAPGPWLLRNTSLASLAPLSRPLAAIFVGAGDPSLDLDGRDAVPG